MPDARTTDPRLLRWDRVVDAPDAQTEDGTGDADGPGDLVHRVEVLGAHAGSVTELVLSCVTGALEAAEVEHFLVARSRSGSRVAVPVGELERLGAALRDLGHRAPVYATVGPRGRRWSGLARDLPPLEDLDHQAIGVLLHAVVTEPVSGLEMGQKQGCRLELWTEDDRGGLVSPAPNPHTPEVTAEDRARPTLGGGPGVPVTVVPPFDRPEVFDVDFPVDAVVLWVDGADPAWRAARDRRRAELGLPPDHPGLEERLYDEHGELRYLLRSLEQYAPWLRRIHLVTAGQRPAWLREDHPWLRLVDHAEFIEDSALPVFSPRPITARMHRIEGLAEHFLYFNDDMILGRSVDPSLFFTSNGLSKFFLSKATVPRTPSDAPHLGARQLMQRLVAERYGVHVARTFRHTPYALTRRAMRRMEETFPEHVDATVHNPFRSAHDVTPEWLHHYLAYLEGEAIPGGVSYGYYRIGNRASLDDFADLLTNRGKDCFCLNDTGAEDVEPAEGERRVLEVLDRLLPLPSSFEVDGPALRSRIP